MDHGHMGHGDMDHGDMGPMCSMNVSYTPPLYALALYHLAKPQNRCSSPGTQPTSASFSPAGE